MRISADIFFRRPGLITAVNMLLVLLVLAAFLVLARDIVAIAFPVREKGVRTERRPAQPVRSSLRDFAVILTNNPFGPPAGDLQPLSGSAGPTLSQSDLLLVGTIAGPKRYSFAFLADKSGQQQVFRPGDDVFGLGRLARVEKDRVFITAGGREVEVPLADITTMKEIKPSQAAVGGLAGLARRTGESTFVLDHQKVQQALERPDQLMTDARFVPNLSEGRQQGFILRELKPGGIYASLGLQNGDILLRINDFTISNPETALQAVTALRGMDRAQLDIIRHGSRITMTYQIR